VPLSRGLIVPDTRKRPVCIAGFVSWLFVSLLLYFMLPGIILAPPIMLVSFFLAALMYPFHVFRFNRVTNTLEEFYRGRTQAAPM